MKITLKEVWRYLKKPKHWWISIVFVIALIGIIYSISNVVYYGKVCNDEACFYEQIIDCKKVTFIKDTEDAIKEYKIIQKNKNSCDIMVKLLFVKQGSVEMESLEGKSMICSVPLGIFSNPEDNLGQCHGILKEDVQEIIIQRMHSQIVENLGKINKELTEVI